MERIGFQATQPSTGTVVDHFWFWDYLFHDIEKLIRQAQSGSGDVALADTAMGKMSAPTLVVPGGNAASASNV